MNKQPIECVYMRLDTEGVRKVLLVAVYALVQLSWEFRAREPSIHWYLSWVCLVVLYAAKVREDRTREGKCQARSENHYKGEWRRAPAKIGKELVFPLLGSHNTAEENICNQKADTHNDKSYE